jgi:hypothetical protein
MLRAYYSRICSQIPVNKSKLNPEFDAIDGGTLDCASLRVQARELIRKLVHESKILEHFHVWRNRRDSLWA